MLPSQLRPLRTLVIIKSQLFIWPTTRNSRQPQAANILFGKIYLVRPKILFIWLLVPEIYNIYVLHQPSLKLGSATTSRAYLIIGKRESAVHYNSSEHDISEIDFIKLDYCL